MSDGFAIRSEAIVVCFFAVVALTYVVGTAGAGSVAMMQLAFCLMAVGLGLVITAFFMQHQVHRFLVYATDEQHAQALTFEPESAKAVIYVFRSHILQRRSALGLDVDLRPWALTGNNTFLRITVNPGVHTVSSVHPNGSRGDYMVAMYEGGVYFFEQYLTFGWGNPRHGIRIVPVEIARRRSVHCRLLMQPTHKANIISDLSTL